MKQKLVDVDKIKNRYNDNWPSEIAEGFQMAIDEIEDAPTVDAVPRSLYEQTQWERDIALSQLKQLNIELGEKPYHKAIPIEWIKEFVNLRATNDGMDGYWHCWGEDVLLMIAQWEKENETIY